MSVKPPRTAGEGRYLYGEWLVFGDIEPYHLALCVKGIEIDVRNDSEWTCCRGGTQLRQVLVGKSGLSTMTPRTGGDLG